MTTLRPNRSPNLPYSGTTIVDVSKYDVTTHDRLSSPPSSPTIVGSAVETMVWSNAASSMTIINAEKTRRTDCGRGAMSGLAVETSAMRSDWFSWVIRDSDL